ncbi:MAG: hypothetical protein WBO95_15330, partial [Candidatus Dechloromonas phosphoritropha]
IQNAIASPTRIWKTSLFRHWLHDRGDNYLDARRYPTVRKPLTAASFPGAIIRDNTFCFSSFGYLTSSSSSPLLFWSEV